MDTEDELEKKIEKNALLIKEISLRIENLNRETDQLLNELNVSPEQIAAFIDNKNHFTEDNWNSLLQLQKALDDKLQRELSNIKDPKKTKKAQSERNIPQHWLYVR